ncbi:MAG TPA: hypothetical protein VK662_06000 [Acidothermaceae bacterium]|nr:hypothetical protein [Acidothermaceae bacterium]
MSSSLGHDAATAALQELQATGGLAGDACVALLRSLASQVTRTNSFPPPEGYTHWGEDAIDDLLADMFAQEGAGAAFVLNCYLKATDERSFERLLLAAIRNYLIDCAKKTERGKLRRRLERLLGEDPRFVRMPASQSGVPRWALAGGPLVPWQGDVADLAAAASSVRGVAINRWNVSGPTPQATQDALLTVAHAILLHAEGAVRDEDLARVIEGRFALLAPPRFTSLDADEDPSDPPNPLSDGPEAQVVSGSRGADIWAALSQTERSLAPHLGKPDAELALVLGVGPRRAAALAAALAEKLRLATTDDEEREDVVAELLRLCVVKP